MTITQTYVQWKNGTMSKGSKYRSVSNKEAFNTNWNNIFNQPKTFLDRKKELKKTGYKEDGKEDNSSGTQNT